MSSIPTKQGGSTMQQFDGSDAYRVWEESLLLPVPTEPPPGSDAATASPLARAIEKTVVVEHAGMTLELGRDVVNLAPESLDTLTERDKLIDQLMRLRDSSTPGTRWVIDLSALRRIPVSVLGALREHHAALAATGGGIKVLLGKRQQLDAHIESMLRRLFDIELV